MNRLSKRYSDVNEMFKIQNKIIMFVNGKRNEVSIKELTNAQYPRPSCWFQTVPV